MANQRPKYGFMNNDHP